MSVTADVWQEAHDYHRQRQQLFALFSQGAGIVTGLEVLASDPPDSAVYIMPGVAIDSEGQIIILSKPRAYNLGTTQGSLYLVITYGESGPRVDDDQPEGLRYMFDEFGIQATPVLPATPYVELARISRKGRDSGIANAEDATHPGANEIDLRLRQQASRTAPDTALIGVGYLGDAPSPTHGRGMEYVARSLRHDRSIFAWVDDGIALDEGLGAYSLVYLVGKDSFQLDKEEMTAVYDYVQGGGTLLLESCRQEVDEGNPPADAAFTDLLGSFGTELEALPPDHDLLHEPYLFGGPPPGFETGDAASLQIGAGIIWSTYDYGCLWQGERRGAPASREEIRTALEWGRNIVYWALKRRGATSSG